MIIPNALTMAAGEVREMACGGNYFELRTSPGIVSLIELLDRSGGVVSLLADAEATDYVRTSRNFEQVRITNGPTAQTLKFYYGDGDSGSNRFTGVVSGTVAMDAATIAALIAGKYNVRPEAQTGSVTDLTAAAIGINATPLLTAANNPNGLILLDGFMQDLGCVMQAMIAHPTLPGSINTGEPVMFGISPGASSAGAINEKFHTPKFISAGKAIWFYSNYATTDAPRSLRGFRYIKL